ncbi:hypothetical protein [Chitinophaga pinensis]|uniref:PQQ-binding-like beta-propeller repeat protein n=1 Tax=Chitinophaga pinensis TaxID=79329 RepID=A0A5C6M2R0_9BACT|nr:hypothetical protein [Chitinophaga pinensis]TWW02279.1 hypothetical protein FEF09_00270 [Chitinophaga pinensis]
MTKSGQIVWSKTYGGSNNEQFRRLRLSRDGDILIAAQTSSYGKSGGEAIAMRIAPDGTPRWSRKFSDASETSLALDIYSTEDNGVVLSGVGYGTFGFSDWQIAKLDPLGNIQWTKRLDYQTAEGAYSVIQKRDTLIFTGDSRAPNDYTCIISKMSVVDGSLYSTRSYTMDNRVHLVVTSITPPENTV